MELAFPLEEAPSEGDLLEVVDVVAGLRIGAAETDLAARVEARDVDAGLELDAGAVVVLEVGVEDRGEILEGVEVLTGAATGLEDFAAGAGTRDVGVEAREGFDFAANVGRLVGVAALEDDGFLPPDDKGLLFAAAAEGPRLFGLGICCRKQCKSLSLNSKNIQVFTSCLHN